MADNGDWTTPMTKGQKKDAKKAAEAEKAKRDELIATMKTTLKGIFNAGSPDEYQTVKMTTIDALKAMGENVSEYERRERVISDMKMEAALKAKKAANKAARLSVNKSKVNKYYTNKHGRHSGVHLNLQKNMIRRRLSTRWMGQNFEPNNANIYAELAKNVNREAAADKRREEVNARSHREWRASMEREYPDWYNRGTAAQGGPAPRPAPKANNWQQRASRGQYEEWTPAATAAVAMYPILGVPVTATKKQIKNAYKAKALEHHPNKGGNEEMFKKLQKEYEAALEVAQEGGRRKTRKSKYRRSRTRKNRS
jgi:hypothetical protein